MDRSRGLPGRLRRREKFPSSRFANFEREPMMERLRQIRQQRYTTSNTDFTEDEPIITPVGSRREFRNHPYHNRQRNIPNMTSNNTPLVETEIEPGPRPLISPETVEQLRARLYRSSKSFHPNMEMWECETYDHEENSYSPPANEPLDANEYIKEEQKTKQQIEEIIMVAQALREKLEKEESMRRNSEYIEPVLVCSSPSYHEPVEDYNSTPYGPEEEYNSGPYRSDDYNSVSYGPVEDFDDQEDNYRPVEDYDHEDIRYRVPSPPHERPRIIPNPNLELFENPETEPGKIPSLLDLKPKIPSLLDLYVPPPPVEKVVKERLIMVTKIANEIGEPGSSDKCWNCQKTGHKFINCRMPQIKKFCYRCGRTGFDVTSCPYCQLLNVAL